MISHEVEKRIVDARLAREIDARLAEAKALGVILLERWYSRSSGWSNIYLPPEDECNMMCLKGTTLNDHRREDGKRIRTTPIVKAEGRVVTTQSGAVYLLGEPDKKWLVWLHGRGEKFDPENPVKIIRRSNDGRNETKKNV